MVLFSSDFLRCSLVQDHSHRNSVGYVMSRMDGTLVDEIDIGQEDSPYRWPKSKKFFSWKFIDHTPDMRFKVQKVAFQEAFNSVQKLTQLTIDFEKDSTKKTDITVEWLEDIAPFDNKRSVLAHANLYHPRRKDNGIMEFNDSPQSKWYFTPLGWPVEAYLVDPLHFKKGEKNKDGSLKMRASQPTVEIAMHELGHILFGRHDVKNRKSLMFPNIKRGYTAGKINKSVFYWDDITSIPRMVAAYGSSNISPRMLQRWRERRVKESTYKRHR